MSTVNSKLSLRDVGRALEAFVLLGIARMLVLLLSFRYVAPLLGSETGEGRRQISPSAVTVVRLAISRSHHRTPWTSNCLAQSLAATWMLKRRGCATTTYLGVRRDANNQIIAHSWTMTGDMFVTGKRAHERFTVTKVFHVNK
ncbi:lasso peptide biosynthesis B2 protein [Exiguobacterium sp. S90]|uniref:lasso peptide biosynthesis B2 protein n=1 Tax=Exiguobacterium sp. S90 TaxID=1221231 RepID=UPI0021115F7A|nr:lasso peptide biosynthesis B2 protein [Exiguobacterium sp. S90]